VAKKSNVVYESEGSHKLLEDADGGLTLEVLVGTSALYAVRMQLNVEEASKYKQGGSSFIDKLAGEVARNEPRYREQGRTRPV